MLSRPIRNPATIGPFKRALVRLRGVQLWTKMLDEVKVYGTGSGLMDQFRTYKECLPEVMRMKRRAWVPLMEDVEVQVPLGLLFHPTSKFKHYWSVLILVLLLYSFLIVPYLIAFIDGSTFWDNIDTTVDVLFAVDILITLNTAVQVAKAKFVTSRWSIFKRYLQGMLLLDVLSIFPFDIVHVESNGANNLVRFLRLAKFSRLLRASKLVKIMSYLAKSDSAKKCSEFLKVYSGVARLITTMYMVVILVHLVSCMWFFSAKLYNFEPNTWVMRKNLQDSNNFTLYLTSFYWAITTLTTVGFGDINAVTSFEMIICMVWMMFGVGFYSMVVGTLSSVLTSLDAKALMINERLQVVELFAKDTHLNEELATRVNKEVKTAVETVTLDEFQRTSILSQLSKPLRLEIAMQMFCGAAEKVMFFREIDSACLAYVLPLLSQRSVPARQFLHRKGDYADEVYFVLTGRLACVYGPRNTAFKSIVAGAYWGEVELIELIPREYSVMTEEDCELLIMSKGLFETMMGEFPTVAQKVRETAIVRHRKNGESLKEVLDVLEAVEIRRSTTLEDLAGKAKVDFDDPTLVREPDPAAVVAEFFASRTDEEIVVQLQKDLVSLSGELDVRRTQGIRHISETALRTVQAGKVFPR